MADDPYTTLGVSKTATAEEIRKAFRTQAKKYHPDLHPGDAAAEARFKALNAAQDLLSDPDKRAAFDRGAIDAEGQPVQPERSFYRDYAGGAQGQRYRPQPDAGGFEADEMGDIFGSFFREQASRPRRGRDRSYRLEVPFLTVVTGATERLTLPDGAVLDVRIPPGLTDGQVLRLRGKGDPGAQGAPDGDALIEVSVLPDETYTRDGRDLTVTVPVPFARAVLGGKLPVPTPGGTVSLTVPPRSDAGTRLRLRGRGIAAGGGEAAGDLFVVLSLVLGPVDAALEEFLRSRADGQEAGA